MHIKRITISGFKSYKNEVQIDNFDKGFNVIVGRNGSGKSNLFAAIQLALTEDFNRLGPVERTALLHLGMPKHDAAFVEVIFDNSTGMLPFDNDEVTFRRYIGGKKDRFVVNGKNVSDFKSFLETAGFVNPYYFVKQGTVTDLATASDSTRLKVITEISGSRVWEATKVEILRMLQTSAQKLSRCRDIIASLDSVKANLEEDEKELMEVLDLEKHKRAFEFLIYDREIKTTQERLEVIDDNRVAIMEIIEPIRVKLSSYAIQLATHKQSTQNVAERRHRLLEQKASLASKINRAIQVKSKEMNDLRDLNNEHEAAQQAKAELEKQLELLAKEEQKLQKELNKLLPTYESCRSDENENSERYAQAQLVSYKTKAKFGLTSGYLGQKMTVKDLKSKLEETREELSRKTQDCTESEVKLENIKSELETFEQQIQRYKDDLKAGIAKRTKLEANLVQIRTSLLDEGIRRNEFSDQEAKIYQSLCDHREILMNCKQKIQKIAGSQKTAAWNGVDIVLQEMRVVGGRVADQILNGYFGQVFENISCEPDVWPAVEVCAGEKLFFHIVSTNAVGLAILKQFNKMKLFGNVVFLPLDKIFVPQLKNLDEPGTTTLSSKIKFPSRVQTAMNHIFANKLLCRTLEIAAKVSKLHQITCVTLEGDKVLCSGPITGGYRDNSISVLGLQEKRVAEETLIINLESDLKVAKARFQESDTGYLTQNKAKESGQLELSRINSIAIDNQNVIIKSALDKLRFKQEEQILEEGRLEKLRKACRALRRQIDELEAEINQTPGGGKANANVSLNASSIKILRENRKQNVKASLESRMAYDKLVKLETRKLKLESSLRNLTNKRTELEMSLQTENTDFFQLKADELVRKIRIVRESVQSDQVNLDELEGQISEADLEYQSWNTAVTKSETSANKYEVKLQQEMSKLEKFQIDRNTMLKALREFEYYIARSGSYPDLVPTFEKLQTKSLAKKLRRINIRLKGCPDVNRAATELLKEVDEKFKEFETEMENSQKEKDEVMKLVEYIDEQKSTIVLKACRALQKSFREIFAELVPDGAAEMVLTSNKGLEFSEKTIFNTPASSNIHELWNNNGFTGMALRVRFTGGFASPRVDMRRFSGGQRSIVALSLILALQKCDPVSLYLFDEVDQALDPQYRGAVALKLHGMSKEAQFICSTFRREFLDYADQFYGVYYRNQASHIKIVSPEEAHEFIEDTPETTVMEIDDNDNGDNNGTNAEDMVVRRLGSLASEVRSGDDGSE